MLPTFPVPPRCRHPLHGWQSPAPCKQAKLCRVAICSAKPYPHRVFCPDQQRRRTEPPRPRYLVGGFNLCVHRPKVKVRSVGGRWAQCLNLNVAHGRVDQLPNVASKRTTFCRVWRFPVQVNLPRWVCDDSPPIAVRYNTTVKRTVRNEAAHVRLPSALGVSTPGHEIQQ